MALLTLKYRERGTGNREPLNPFAFTVPRSPFPVPDKVVLWNS